MKFYDSMNWYHVDSFHRLPWWLSRKESTCSVRDLGLIPGLGRFPGGGHGNPLQSSGLENPMARGAWQLQSMGSQRVRHYWVTFTFTFWFFPCHCIHSLVAFKKKIYAMRPLSLFLSWNLTHNLSCFSWRGCKNLLARLSLPTPHHCLQSKKGKER